MINIYPNFFSDLELDNIKSCLNNSTLQDSPNGINVKTTGLVKFNVDDRIKFLGQNNIYQEVLVYETGSYSPEHIDAGYGKYNWTRTGILICNEDYDGGELFFSKLNITMKPPTNTMIILPAGKSSSMYAHGVNKITHGKRVTAIFRFIE